MIQLPDISTDAGVLCRLMIAECENPGYSDYNESDGQLSFRLMQAVVSNRLNNNPAQFGAPGARTQTDIITAPNQFNGFSMSGGQAQISQSIADLINTVMANANAGSPGVYYQFVQDIIDRVNSTVNDPFAGLTSINQTPVQGGTYAWRTVGSGDPGGRFFAIPATAGGVILGNQFYTLLPATTDQAMGIEKHSPTFRARFKDGATFLNFLKSAGDAAMHVLQGYVKKAESDSSILFSHNPEAGTWTELKTKDIGEIEYYGAELHGTVMCARVSITVSIPTKTSWFSELGSTHNHKAGTTAAKKSKVGKTRQSGNG